LELEYELLLLRFQEMLVLSIDGFRICGLCRFEQAVFDCHICRETYCKLCYDDNHFFNQHPVVLIVKKRNLEIEQSEYDIVAGGNYYIGVLFFKIKRSKLKR
jgi:hypothetical protein